MAQSPACINCLKWNLFREKCWFFWEAKKFCPNKVETDDSWDESRAYTGL